MKANLASYIELLTPWLSTELVSEPYMTRIREIGAGLPLLSFGCFECWLAADEMRVDFNIGITGKLNEQKTLLEWFARLPEPDREPQKAALEKLQRICSTWSDRRLFLHAQVKILWLVYDIPDPLHGTGVPWLYIHFRENRFMNDAVVRPEVILQTLTLMDNRYSEEERNSFRAFFESVSPSVQICALGTPTGRAGNLLRVYVKVQTFPDVLRVLTDQQWPGDVEELRQQMGHLALHCDFFALLIDINPAIQPKIGLECWFDETHTQQKLSNFTTYLLEKGLCSSQKRDALLDWNGRFETQLSPLFWSWPDPMRPANTEAAQPVTIRKMAHYVKLVYEPGKPLVAKAYLYFDRLPKGS